MQEIILASSNKGKVKEVQAILEGTGIKVIPLSETGFTDEIEENGSTFEENAIIKATVVAKALGKAVLADDSGLEIDYLGKEPGIYSARYLGHDTPYDIKNQMILDKLKNVPDEERTARFVCSMAFVLPNGETFTSYATMEGQIGHKICGENGFGYDPIFFLPEYGMSSAQISPEEKNAISHRGKALRMIKDKIVTLSW